MRRIGAVLAMCLGLMPGAQALAGVTLGAPPGQPAERSGPVMPPPVWPLPPLKLGAKPPALESDMIIRKRPFDDGDRRLRRRGRFLFFPHFFFPHFDHDDAERIIVMPAPPAPPPEPEPAAGPEPAPPPDPRGPAIRRARGAGKGVAYVVGESLPPELPHVALDWRIHGLPEPPPGLAYARVGRDVLLIDPASRVVERRLEPAELAPGGG